jgi:anti-anti-sigma factor
MNISKSVGPDSKTIRLAGSITRLDMKTLQHELVDSHCFDRINIDLTHADFIDSAFLGFLLAIRKTKPKEFEKIQILNPNPFIMDILKTSGLNEVVPVVNLKKGEAA